jgi:protocatechuate 3,4-dioxygenase beta subunit
VTITIREEERMARSPSVISGVVLSPDGKPVSNARVYFTAGPVPLPEIAAVTDNSGAFTLTAPAPGEYVIESAADEFGARSSKVKVKGGEQVRLDLKLKG